MALLQGNPDVPDCVDCHGDHDIVSLSAQDGKRDYAATQVCIWCHTNERLMGRYGMDTSQAENYMNDFHGLAQKSSLGATATCADCHDAHKSLNHEDPASSMHVDNRKDACAKCHGDASEAFVMSFTHKHTTGDESRFVINRIVTIVYILLIIAVIGGMLLHNLIIWSFYVRRKFRSQQKSKCKVVRMNGFERIWHWALFFSFTLLGITGFALVYPDSWVFSWMFDSFLSEQSRAWMHRAAAIVMCVDMGIFLVYKTVTSHGRNRWWKEMFPGWHDIKDVFVTMTYHLGITKEKPLYRVFNYAEKAEYWALWWGTLVMAVTGFVLWFSHLLPAGTPDWLLDISLTIHFYEAILACMSIAVWHFFFVIYHPEEYPVNLSSITGRLTDHEAEERFTKEAIKIQEEE